MRRGFKMKLYEGMAEEYKKRHDALWPEMKEMIPVHCASNMDDGVAHFIEDNILKEANA